MLTPLQLEIAVLIVESLNLEQRAADLDPKAPLYQQGLGLDSIDLLELSVILSKTYGFQIKSDDPDMTQIFASLESLTDTVDRRRSR
jgi:acyl carrier protein